MLFSCIYEVNSTAIYYDLTDGNLKVCKYCLNYLDSIKIIICRTCDLFEKKKLAVVINSDYIPL